MSNKNVWSEIGRFNLSVEEVETVFIVAEGAVKLKKVQYASTIAKALSEEIPGRFTSFGSPSSNKSSFIFRFVKCCYNQQKCLKKWKVVCENQSIINGHNEFIICTNNFDCFHSHPLMPRPLTGKYLEHHQS